jgi:pyruvate/2-oxoglutarate dehydrogenase complex dihydrolipoamide acyltransferase (E2) component
MTTIFDKPVPAEACKFAGGVAQFAAPAEKDAKSIPIRMVARSPQPIDHYWFGRCVHDLDGMQVEGATIPCDYAHGEPIGYLDAFDASSREGLIVEGALVPTSSPLDRVRHLAELSAGGVPFQSSIYFADEMQVEWIPDGATTLVNGYQFAGPGNVIRKWTLRGVALCPYGYDAKTSAQFAADAGKSFSVKPYGNPMKTALTAPAADPATTPATDPAATPATATTPAAAPADATVAPPAAGELSAERQEAGRFRTAFGDQGAVWFAEGLTFDQAQAKFATEISAKSAAENKVLADRLTALETKLSAGAKASGEATPVGFQAGDDAPKKHQGFAAKIRMPGTPAPATA